MSALPAITIEWEEVERRRCEHETSLPHGLSIIDLANFEDGADQYFKERLVYDEKHNVLHVRYAYDYEVDLDRLNSPMDLLHWTDHLLAKNWMTTEKVSHFVRKVCDIKGWNLFYSL